MGIILVNFGGPRSISEIEPFLCELLTDRDVIRTKLPPFVQKWFFTRIAKKRAVKIAEDYHLIGGKSPIFEDTEAIASALRERLKVEVVTFHRYLPQTHACFLEERKKLHGDITVFPLFPQFSYATTGSIARWMFNQGIGNLRWIKSYSDHPAFIIAFRQLIREFLEQNHLEQRETVLLFTAHGLPQKFVEQGDGYQSECEDSFTQISFDFPEALCRLSYQSKFGRGEWLRPYTQEVCEEILSWRKDCVQVVFIPLSFTSDHIETLFEIEYQYMPLIRERGLSAYRCPAFNLREQWLDAIEEIIASSNKEDTKALIR